MKHILISILIFLALLFPQNLPEPVPPVTTISTSELIKQVDCVKSVLYFESRGEPPEGIHAVLSVVYNRTKHPKFPSDYCGVVKQPYQFSYLNKYQGKGKVVNVVKPTYKPSEHKVKATIDQLAFEAAVGSLKPSLKPEYLFYHTTKLKKIPAWSKQAKTKVIIGNHIFIGA